jgi:hypothetical protein
MYDQPWLIWRRIMKMKHSRRAFFQRAAGAGMAAGCGDVARVLSQSGFVLGQESHAEVVKLQPEMEPLVRLLEDTPRNRLLEEVGARIREGLAYQDVLAGLLLAGVRNVEPRPSVGFKFHAVLVVQSVHLASIALPADDRWIPIFWALDYFKDSQARDERERGWTMGPVDESAVPDAGKGTDEFIRAMDRWNEPGADAATAALARSGNPDQIWELFFRYGARDFRSIGHKAIDVANTHRVLGVIGWQHAEPALRSLAYALLMHEDGNPADRDDKADLPWRSNQELAAQLPEEWRQGSQGGEATIELLETLRDGSEFEAAEKVVQLLRKGAGAQSIWDGLFLGAVELLVRQPGIVALHSVTTTNALHYAYRQAREDLTQRLLLLQNAAFLPMFRQAMHGRGRVGDFAVDQMESVKAESEASAAVDDIFADVSGNRMAAARKTLGYCEADYPLEPWVQKARELIARKGTGAHDFKFGCAVLEDTAHVSKKWLGRFLAASVYSLQGSKKADNPSVARTRKALEGSG